MNVELSEATQAMYLERLRKLSGNEMRVAGERTTVEWTEASKMPPLAFILERTAVEPELKEYRIPADWQSIPAARHKILPQQIEEWLEGGRIAQQEHIAKLEADPEWQKMCDQLGGKPGLVKRTQIEVMTPEQRSSWARQKAEDQGWL